MTNIYKRQHKTTKNNIKIPSCLWFVLRDPKVSSPSRNILLSILKSHGKRQKTAELPPNVNSIRVRSYIAELSKFDLFAQFFYGKKLLQFSFKKEIEEKIKSERRYLHIDAKKYSSISGRSGKTLLLLLKKQNTGKLYIRRDTIIGDFGNDNLSQYLHRAKKQVKKT